MAEVFQTTLGFNNIAWFVMACGALVLLDRIRQTLKALHTIELARFKRERPEVFEN
jgi:hypothetical protein